MAYANRADVELLYGAANIVIWANLESGDPEDEDVADAIDARIASALADAEADVDDRTRGGPYAVPFPSVPVCIKRATALLAGVMLYEARGVTDFDSETGKPQHQLQYQKKEAEAICASVRSGARVLSILRIRGEAPQVVPVI